MPKPDPRKEMNKSRIASASRKNEHNGQCHSSSHGEQSCSFEAMSGEPKPVNQGGSRRTNQEQRRNRSAAGIHAARMPVMIAPPVVESGRTSGEPMPSNPGRSKRTNQERRRNRLPARIHAARKLVMVVPPVVVNGI